MDYSQFSLSHRGSRRHLLEEEGDEELWRKLWYGGGGDDDLSHSDSMERRYQHHAFTVTDAETEEKRDYWSWQWQQFHGYVVCQDQDDEDLLLYSSSNNNMDHSDSDLLLYDGNNHYYVYRDQDGGHLLSVPDAGEGNENEDLHKRKIRHCVKTYQWILYHC